MQGNALNGPSRQYGVVMPHFGRYASREMIVQGAQAAEALGFDSLWFRDHVVYQTHAWEDSDLRFVDPFIAMSAAAGQTTRVILGTAALIPHRHPIHTAVLASSLDLVAGPNRVVLGWGLGAYDREFQAIGMGGWDRKELWREQVEIVKRLMAGETVSHQGKFYEFDDVMIRPKPTLGSIRIWYCGLAQASVRRAVEMCDGWGPADMPRRDFRARMSLMRRLAADAGRSVPTAAIRSLVSPAATVSDAERMFDLQPLLAKAPKLYMRPESGSFASIRDLDGAVIAGPAEKIIEEVRLYEEEGAEHFVFDLRSRFADWDSLLRFIGEEVLPALRAQNGRDAAKPTH